MELTPRGIARSVVRSAVSRANSFGATPIMTDMIKGVPKDKVDAVVANLAVKRLGSYQDCSNVCDFFVSPTSDNITGQVLYLGGIS